MWLNKNNYKKYLKGINVLEISGAGCANCVSLMPILSNIIALYPNVGLFHIELDDDNYEFAEIFNIQAVPTILVLHDLDIKASCKSYQPEEILSLWLEAKINDIN